MNFFRRRKKFRTKVHMDSSSSGNEFVFELIAEGGMGFLAITAHADRLCLHIFEGETGAGAAFNMMPSETAAFRSWLRDVDDRLAKLNVA